MHTPEMSRRLMFLGIADGAQRSVGLYRNLAKRRSSECQRGRGKHAPIRVVVVARLGCRFERQPRPIEADQAVGELVLDGLELTDELAELLSDLGMIHGQ